MLIVTGTGITFCASDVINCVDQLLGIFFLMFWAVCQGKNFENPPISDEAMSSLVGLL